MTKPNILFILIDALRADKFFGQKKTSSTPNLDKLIKDGVYFEQAISSADATILSWAGLFTGNHPFKTGIRSSKFNKLDKKTPTFFDVLKKSGYHFYSYLPPSGKIIGIFPEFENDDSYDEIPRFGKGLDEKVSNFLSSTKKEPWFLYLHSYNLHFPILTPKGFEDTKFGINNYEKQISLIDYSIGELIKKIDLENTLVILTADHGSYFQTIEHNGKKLNYEAKGDLQNLSLKLSNKIPKSLHSTKTKLFVNFEKIKKKKQIKNIKNLNLKPSELRGLLHQRSNPDKFLFDDLVHVPLLFLGCGINSSKNVTQQVRLIDIFPTICEIFELDNLKNIDGKSFHALIKGNTIKENPAYLESTPLIQIKTNDVIGVRTSQFKYFRDRYDSNKRKFLFNLQTDKDENFNISNDDKTTIEMEKILKNIIHGYDFLKNGQTLKNPDEDSEKINDVLKKLGYI